MSLKIMREHKYSRNQKSLSRGEKELKTYIQICKFKNFQREGKGEEEEQRNPIKDFMIKGSQMRNYQE